MKTPATAYSADSHPTARPLQPLHSKTVSGAGDEQFFIDHARQLAGRISAGLAADEMAADVAAFTAGVAGCESCSIYLREADDLVLRGGNNGQAASASRVSVKKIEAATGWIAERSDPIMSENAAFSDPRVAPFNAASGEKFESSCLVPIARAGRLIGVIHTQDHASRPYARGTIGFLAIVAGLVGAELERARLESENLHLSEQMEARKLIERAKGILQRDMQLTEEDAYLTLQRESRQRRKPMKEVASAIILSEELKRSR